MKKLLIASNVLFLGIILFQARSQSTARIVYKSNYFSSLADSCGICKDYSGMPLEGIISGRLLEKMSVLYSRDPGKSKVNYNPCNGGFITKRPQDALSVCFDLEKVKNFVWHIQTAACNAHCDSTLQLGIRFYYIKYDTAGMDTRDEMRSWIIHNGLLYKHSLAMVPAYSKNGEWHDFDYTQTIESPCVFRPVHSVNAKIFGVTSMGNADNHGGIGPPPQPGTYPTN